MVLRTEIKRGSVVLTNIILDHLGSFVITF
jgi:hypothetical protein